MDKSKPNEENFNSIFNSVEAKAKAFDKIAERYYFANFGSMSKTDFDVLMFSIYIEEILNKSQNDFKTYSDYTLSKQLGITQSKVSNLKVKKELLFPYSEFNWRKTLLKISENAIYEDGKIKLFVPDKNVFIEVKNAIEENGGFIEVQLTSNLLQIRIEYFLDLLVAISDELERGKFKKEVQNRIREHDKDVKFIKAESFGKVLKNKAPELIIDIVSECIPVFGRMVQTLANNILQVIIENKGE